MSQNLTILVTTSKHPRQIVRLAQAAAERGKPVRIHFTGAGVRLAQPCLLSELTGGAQVSVCRESLEDPSVTDHPPDVDSGLLAVWDVRLLQNRDYSLRVVVYDSAGNGYEARSWVWVQNPQPTDTPIPTWTPTEAPTATPVPTLTPVPSDTPWPTMTPTPTPTTTPFVLPTLSPPPTVSIPTWTPVPPITITVSINP